MRRVSPNGALYGPPGSKFEVPSCTLRQCFRTYMTVPSTSSMFSRMRPHLHVCAFQDSLADTVALALKAPTCHSWSRGGSIAKTQTVGARRRCTVHTYIHNPPHSDSSGVSRRIQVTFLGVYRSTERSAWPPTWLLPWLYCAYKCRQYEQDGQKRAFCFPFVAKTNRFWSLSIMFRTHYSISAAFYPN
jgi:hypothetical protein